MVAATLVLLPKGTLTPNLWRDVARVAAAGAGTVAVVRLLGDPSLWAGVPVALLSYLGIVALLGGIRWRDLSLLRDAVRQKPNRVTRGSESC
jgi:hypothetical protein